MTRPPSFFISITHRVSIKTADKYLKARKCLLKALGAGFGCTHTAPQILGNREIHFHAKSASIREALKGGYDIMTRILFSNIFQHGVEQTRRLSASLVL